MGFGFWEIAGIVVILLILFGASRIPKLARGLGEGVSEFKKGLKEGENAEGQEEPPEIPPSEQEEKNPEHTE